MKIKIFTKNNAINIYTITNKSIRIRDRNKSKKKLIRFDWFEFNHWDEIHSAGSKFFQYYYRKIIISHIRTCYTQVILPRAETTRYVVLRSITLIVNGDRKRLMYTEKYDVSRRSFTEVGQKYHRNQSYERDLRTRWDTIIVYNRISSFSGVRTK